MLYFKARLSGSSYHIWYVIVFKQKKFHKLYANIHIHVSLLNFKINSCGIWENVFFSEAKFNMLYSYIINKIKAR